MDRARLLALICEALGKGDRDSAAEILSQRYPFEVTEKQTRKYTEYEKTRIFHRDGFIDRYKGTRLIFPPVLRLVSDALPDQFPFHTNWKMSESHIAYWELSATIDHLVPVARGGADDESNWVCCSMLTNGIKANWTLEECGWQLHERGDFSTWDGLLNWFIVEVEKHPELQAKPHYRGWYKAAKSLTIL